MGRRGRHRGDSHGHVLVKQTEAQKRLDKVRRIRTILAQPVIDVEELRELGRHSEGYVLDDLRRSVWPYLLNITEEDYTPYEARIQEHKDTSQIDRDIDRSLWRFTARSRHHNRLVKRKQLSDILNALVCIHPHLHYYQGYHDLCSVFLLVCGRRHAYPLCERVSLTLVRHCLSSDLKPVMNELTLLFPLIHCRDPELYAFLITSGVNPFFAVAWILTWGSHDVANFGTVTRLFDFFLVSPPTMSLYFCAAVVLDCRDQVLAVECDFAAVHESLGLIMTNTRVISDRVEQYIATASQLYHEHPVEALEAHALRLNPGMKKEDILGPRDAAIREYPYTWMQTTQAPLDMARAGERSIQMWGEEGTQTFDTQIRALSKLPGAGTVTKVSFWALMGTVVASAGAVALELADVGLASLLA